MNSKKSSTGIHIKPSHEGDFTAKANAAGMGVQAYASKVLSAPEGQYDPSTRKQANFARNAAGWNHEMGGNMYATGGSFNNKGFMSLPKEVQNKIRSRAFADGGPMEAQLTEFSEGGRHEENPLGGIPQGTAPDGRVNLVEQGETKLNSENYIFSDSLKVDKATAEEFALPKNEVGKTFAEISKKFNRPNSRRENDTIEQVAIQRDLDNLMKAQEAFKAQQVEEKIAEIQSLDPNALAQIAQSYQPQGMPPQGMEGAPGMEQGQMPQGQPSPEEMAMMEQQGQMMDPAMQGQPPMDPAMMEQMMAQQQGAPQMMQYGGPMSYKCGGGMYNYGGHLTSNQFYTGGGLPSEGFRDFGAGTAAANFENNPNNTLSNPYAQNNGLNGNVNNGLNNQTLGTNSNSLNNNTNSQEEVSGGSGSNLGTAVAIGTTVAGTAANLANKDLSDTQKGEAAYNGAKGVVTAINPIIGGIIGIGDAIGKPIKNKLEATDPETGELVDPNKAKLGYMANVVLNPAKNLAHTLFDKDASTKDKIFAGLTGGYSDLFRANDYVKDLEEDNKTEFAANNAVAKYGGYQYDNGGNLGDPPTNLTPAEQLKINQKYTNDTGIKLNSGENANISPADLAAMQAGKDFATYYNPVPTNTYVPAMPTAENVAYMVNEDPMGKSRWVDQGVYNTFKGNKTKMQLDSQGFPLMAGSGARYKEYVDSRASQAPVTFGKGGLMNYPTYKDNAGPMGQPLTNLYNMGGNMSNPYENSMSAFEFGGDLDFDNEDDFINYLDQDTDTTRSFDNGGRFSPQYRDRFGNFTGGDNNYVPQTDAELMNNPFNKQSVEENLQFNLPTSDFDKMSPAEKEQYLSDLARAQEQLKNKQVDLSMNQTWGQAAGLALPAAYNIGRGLFGKVGTLNAKDYYQTADFEGQKYNMNPEKFAADQTFAGAANAVRNAAPGGGAYMTNMQNLARLRNEAMMNINRTKQEREMASAQDAQIRNKAIEAANLGVKANVDDYNIKTREAKSKSLETGLGQIAKMTENAVNNDVQTNFVKAVAPDFAGTVGYNTVIDQLLATRKASKEAKNKNNNKTV
jgi:hypothetical protein